MAEADTKSQHVKKIAIIGGSGQIGKHITEQLINAQRFNLTALTRPDSTSVFPEEINVVRVDYSSDNDEQLVASLRGQQVLIIAISAAAAKNTISKLSQAAAKAGVPYIFPNWYGHDPTHEALCTDGPYGAVRDAICGEIESLGVSSYIQLVCNFWYEFSLDGGTDRFGFDFKKREVVQFDDGNTVINTSTWPQCGRAIAAILSLKELPDSPSDTSPTLAQFRNKPVYISSFRISQQDMFDSVKRVTGTTDADWTVSRVSAEKRWREGKEGAMKGDVSAFMRWIYGRMFLPGGGGDYEGTRGLQNEMLGLPVEDLDEATRVGIRMAEDAEVSRYG